MEEYEENSNRQRGMTMERYAACYLEQQGLLPITANYQCRVGEIDLIMRDQDTLVFVEVRYRRSEQHGTATETVTSYKQCRLIRCARHYLMQQRLHETMACRFDVVGIRADGSIEWIPNAFSQFPV
ncbi:MAG: YraN family protein [Pseudomonadota bacterium]